MSRLHVVSIISLQFFSVEALYENVLTEHLSRYLEDRFFKYSIQNFQVPPALNAVPNFFPGYLSTISSLAYLLSITTCESNITSWRWRLRQLDSVRRKKLGRRTGRSSPMEQISQPKLVPRKRWGTKKCSKNIVKYFLPGILFTQYGNRPVFISILSVKQNEPLFTLSVTNPVFRGNLQEFYRNNII